MLLLTEAVVVTPASLTQAERRAVEALVTEIAARARLTLALTHVPPPGGAAAIVVGQRSALEKHFPGAAALLASNESTAAEGFSAVAEGNRVVLAGNDTRGVLYAVGHLLRRLQMAPGRINLPLPYAELTSPRWPLRGHQLGYRPLPNCYTGWDVPQWERYIRELALWGANAIELLPPNTGGPAESDHFPLPRLQMMVEMTKIIASYGLDVWVWYPLLEEDYANAETVQRSLQEWDEVFSKLPRVDGIFVPGGDPGSTPPQLLFPHLEKLIAQVRRHHPAARMWVSPQGYSGEEMEYFFEYLQRVRPDWLEGVVFGPWVHLPLDEFRARIPSEYAVRYYPDITHTRHCQYPVADWDLAFALTQGREPTCPRPVAMANILRELQPHTVGAICYSEGAHDDVNKAIWSALSWDPDQDVVELLRDYGRFFVAERFADAFAQSLLALERNWQGALLTNEGVYATLQSMRNMEDAADPHLLKNWRFLQPLFRAYCDAYTRLRLINETALEDRALDALREAEFKGPSVAMTQAESILDQAVLDPPGRAWRTRIFQLAEALYQTIHHKLSVPLYHGLAIGRGAHLDSLDWPLNNRLWLKAQFAKIRNSATEPERLRQIEEILNWQNPGPGGHYDSPGALPVTPRVERGVGPGEDPAFLQSSLVGFLYLTQEPLPCRYSSMSCVCSVGDAPLHMNYHGLDPQADYELRIIYGHGEYKRRIRLEAEGIQIHDYLIKPDPPASLTFPVPRATIRSGHLRLRWQCEKGPLHEGYGCAVAEIWLMRKDRLDLAKVAEEKWRYQRG